MHRMTDAGMTAQQIGDLRVMERVDDLLCSHAGICHPQDEVPHGGVELAVGRHGQVVQDVGRELACGEVVGDRCLFDGDAVPLPVGAAFGVGEASDDPSDVRGERPGAAGCEDGAGAADGSSFGEPGVGPVDVAHPEFADARAAVWSSSHRGTAWKTSVRSHSLTTSRTTALCTSTPTGAPPATTAATAWTMRAATR